MSISEEELPLRPPEPRSPRCSSPMYRGSPFYRGALAVGIARRYYGKGDNRDRGYWLYRATRRAAGSKYDPRPDTFGTVDEATSALGLARAATKDQNVKEMILAIQQDLYLLMAELATPPENYEKIGYRVTAEHVHRLKQQEEALKREVKIPNTFVIPGDTLDGAALDLARTIIRRAERLAVKLLHDGVIENKELVVYLNRLSDLVFIIARYVEVKSSLAQRPQ
jgi:cob(I)alamin adenosyltransferase